MKKFLGLIVILTLTLNVSAQEKGSFITINGGLGPSGFSYDLKGISSDGSVQHKLGWNANIGYSYFFTRGFGLSTGVGISYYNSIGKFNDAFSRENYYNLGNQIDDDYLYGPNEYELRARLFNWKESQQAYFIDIPLLISLKHKFGDKKVFGLFLNAGAKLKIPIIRKDFYVIDSHEDMFNVSAYYSEHKLEIGVNPDPQAPEHGFGTINNPNESLQWNGELSIKPSIALVGEAGFLFGLSRRVDLILGAYIDYGLNNIKKDETSLLIAPENYQPSANYHIGNDIAYAGMINSDATDKVSTLSYGGKIGLAIKLGKLPSEEKVKDTIVSDNSDIYAILLQSQEELARLNAQLDSLKNAQSSSIQGVILDGIVLDAKSKTPVPTAVLEIVNANNEIIAASVSDPNTAKFNIVLDYGEYTINTTKGGYIFKSETLSILKTENQQIINKIIFLDKIEVDKTVILNNVHFDFDKATLKQASQVEIDKVVRFLKENPTVTLELAGHTDDAGPSYYNKRLSQRRAQTVVNELVKQGIAPERLTAVGYGKTKPIATNETAKGRALNRRTEFKILKF